MWRRVRYVLLLVALCALATCPSAYRSCTNKRRAGEAQELLDVIGDRVAAIATATGKVPPVPAGPTPMPSCCERGGTCEPDDSTWSAPGWRALGFTIDGDYRFTYQYIPDPSGTSAIVRASGDVACDGTPSVYELRLDVAGGTVERAFTKKELAE